MIKPAFSGKLICESVAKNNATDSQITDLLIDIKVLELPDLLFCYLVTICDWFI
jgi:hypothetical protein